MYKTIWYIIDNTENIPTEFTFYHFKKSPKFPSWYMEENHNYTIEVLWNFKLTNTISTFFKCLTKFYIVQ